MCNSELILEKIAHLSEKIEIYSGNSERERDQVCERLSLINDSILELDSKVNLQNGRVGKIEEVQNHCPGKILENSFNQYQKELKPVYILATNIKLIAVIVIASALVFNVVDAAMTYLLNFLT